MPPLKEYVVLDSDDQPNASLPGVCVVIPTYRHALTVAQTLESLFAQTYPPAEVIVVNDGSPDDTDASIAPYMDRITYIKQSNSGMSAAANRGFGLCSQPLVMFLASDDWLAPKALATLMRALVDNPDAGVAYGQVIVVDREGRPLGTDFTGVEPRKIGRHDALPLLLRGNYLPALLRCTGQRHSEKLALSWTSRTVRIGQC